MKTPLRMRLALLAGLLAVSLLVVGVSVQAVQAAPAGFNLTQLHRLHDPSARATSSGSAASSSVGSASVKVPQTQWQSRRLLDAWAEKGQLGIIPVPPGVRGPLVATASGGGLSRDTSIALMMGTAVIAALLIGASAVAWSRRKQLQQPECVGEGCSNTA